MFPKNSGKGVELVLLYLFCRWRTEAHSDESSSQTAYLAHLLTPVLLTLHKPNQVKNEQGTCDDALMTKHGGGFKDLSSHQEGPMLSSKAPRICLHALRGLHTKIFYETNKQINWEKYLKWEMPSEIPWKQCHQRHDRFAWVKIVSHCVLLLSLKTFEEGQPCVCISSVCGLEWVLVQMGLVWNEVFYASFGINPRV